MSSNIEHVVIEKSRGNIQAFCNFRDDGTSRSSVWNGLTWIEATYETHEPAIAIAADFVRSGHSCRSMITGERA